MCSKHWRFIVSIAIFQYSIYLLNEIVKIIVSDYIIYANHFDGPDIEVTILKLTIFLLLPVSALNTTVHN